LEAAGDGRVTVSPPELRTPSPGGPRGEPARVASGAGTKLTSPGDSQGDADRVAARIETPRPASVAVNRSAESGARPEAEAPRLADALASHLSHIETQQALNVLARLHGEPYRLQIPFATAEGLATALLAVQPDNSGAEDDAGKERGYNVLFHLDLK